jgi:hypothetical protein
LWDANLTVEKQRCLLGGCGSRESRQIEDLGLVGRRVIIWGLIFADDFKLIVDLQRVAVADGPG